MDCLGIDFGRSSIKYGVVGIDEALTVKDFNAIPLPPEPQQADYSAALEAAVQRSSGFSAAGIGFPTLVKHNRLTNFSLKYSEMWADISRLLADLGVPSVALNDADAAGIAEVYRPEAEHLRSGVTIVLTLGTGIGSALFLDGKLLPNTEMGSFELHGMIVEEFAAASVKTSSGLSYSEWGARLNEYLQMLEYLLSPDKIVIGGGISAEFELFRRFLHTHAELSQAHYLNQAGVIGSALYAANVCEVQPG